MIASEARIAANRLNARKSTGPKSAEGKERSRGNAVKHGMTGEGIALGSEEAAAVEARLAGFRADYRPVTAAGLALVARAAMLSVRLERCAVREAAAISSRVRAAEGDFDEARAAEVDALFEKLATEPGPALRRLRRMPEGVDRLVEAWKGLRWELDRGDGSRWKEAHLATALQLLGRKPGGFGMPRVEVLSKAFGGNSFFLDAADGAGLDGPGRRQWARRELLGLIDGAIAELEAHRATIDLDLIAADRAGAEARALFDPSKEATLARKYEAAAEREMHRALKEMKAIEAEAADRGESRPRPAPPLGSFSPAASSPPPAPAPMPVPMPSSSRFGGGEGSTFIPMTIGRAEDGSR